MGSLSMTETPQGPIPTRINYVQEKLPLTAFEACPGKGVNYPDLNKRIFGQHQTLNLEKMCGRHQNVEFPGRCFYYLMLHQCSSN